MIPVNRFSIGAITLSCWALAGLIWWLGLEGGTEVWQGALSRVGVVMAAVWLAMPTRHRDAAWAHVPWPWLAGTLLFLVAVLRTKAPLKILIPGTLALAGVILVLRPRSKVRP